MAEQKKKTGPKKKVVVEQPKIEMEEVIIIEDSPTVIATVTDEELTSNTVSVSVEDVEQESLIPTTDDWQEESVLEDSEQEATGDTPDDDWPDDVKADWYTPRVYDENRPWINIGVVCGMKELKYREMKKQLDMVLWQLPPWKYKHRIHGLYFSANYFSVRRYAEARKKDFQTCPIYYKHGTRARIMAFEHLVKMTKGGVILIMKDKEDGAISKLIQMANAYGIKTIVVEY